MAGRDWPREEGASRGGRFKRGEAGVARACGPALTAPVTKMVRTKADSPSTSTGSFRKAVAARAPRKALGCASTANVSLTSPGKKENKYAGGNPVCPRPTPKWQKGIGEFFGPFKQPGKENTEPSDISSSSKAGTSKAPRRARVLPEDSEEAASDEEN
ncbi:PCNA-associated factor [Chiloscyllium punctatum]|uniref:PCNA-associated factor n=1 Tax=Chiloscyllium plagiosum TaxID=36176 RepID=UPI001CB82C85|nr:PCNA-associated factor [Chiloscyllium plagiosum]